MKVKVVVGFVEPAGFTRVKGDVVELDNAYATELLELGKVERLDDQPKASKAKSKSRRDRRVKK